MARAEGSVVINRPVEDVWAYLSDANNVPEWMSYVLKAERTSEGPVAVGTTFQGVSHFLGRRAEWTSTIIRREPNRSWTEIVSSPPIAFTETYIFEPVERGTKFTFVVEGTTGGVFRLADPIVVRLFQRDIETNLANLKDILETKG